MDQEHDAASARREALRISEQKEAIEAEMDDIVETLTQNNGPGLQGSLVDKDGFPRSDIDIHLVRQQRNRFARLRNDHKSITSQIEKLLRIALAPNPSNSTEDTNGSIANSTSSAPASTPASAVPSTTSTTPSRSQSRQVQDLRQPFALVDQVFPNSPSSDAGLQVNDKIIAFGAVSLRSSPTPEQAMTLLPGLVREHQNIAVDVVVQRRKPAEPLRTGVDTAPETEVVTVSLTPRRWSGQGLLGCHIVPLSISQVDPTYAPEVATAAINRNVPKGNGTANGH